VFVIAPPVPLGLPAVLDWQEASNTIVARARSVPDATPKLVQHLGDALSPFKRFTMDL
jgi:hypothetical protein